MTADRSIIHDSENVRLVAQELGGDVVFVTFNEMGLTWKGDAFWGDAFFEKNGLTAFGFVTPRPNWYPADEMERRVIDLGLSAFPDNPSLLAARKGSVDPVTALVPGTRNPVFRGIANGYRYKCIGCPPGR